MYLLALFWHLVKKNLWWKQFLPSSWMRAETPLSQSDRVLKHPARQGWLLLHQGAGCFLEMFMQFNCAAAEATDTHTQKNPKATHTHKKNPTPKTPRLRPLRPLVYLTQVLPSTKYCQISVLFGPEGRRELESCLCCCQCFLMMFLTRENELVCLRIQIPCGAWFGKLKICEGK